MTEARDGVVWDLGSYFPSFDGPEMRQFKEPNTAVFSTSRNGVATLRLKDPRTAPPAKN